MELISSIHKRWKLFAFWCLIGCFIIILSLDQSQQNANFTTARNTMSQLLAPTSSISLQNANISAQSLAPLEHEFIPPRSGSIEAPNPPTEKLEVVKEDVGEKSCNFFEGRWIYKAEENPPYNSTTCPFLEEKVSCQKNGRPDSEYEKWKWEATGCDLPEFNAIDMLERLRDKRVIMVGDSLNRNQWQSLACLIYSNISPSRAEVDVVSAEYKIFKAKDYNFILEFYWTPFLVKLDEKHESGSKVLELEKISCNSEKWLNADIMVFNSGHWWTHPGKLRSWQLFEYEGKLVEELPLEVAFERGMRTWASWIETNVDPNKTKVFFRSVSPDHTWTQWCYNVTQPIMDESYESRFPKYMTEIIEKMVEEAKEKSHVKYLNITKLSEYRKDAHPSVYRNGMWKNSSEENQKIVRSYADCSHWCLPGLPDTWNRMFYGLLFFDSSKDLDLNPTVDHKIEATNVALEDNNTSSENVSTSHIEKLGNKINKRCNIFDGRWVYQQDQEPSYNASHCDFIDKKVNCRKNGRTDLEYEKWIWEARDCDVPLFSATGMLEVLRNKRLAIVGDSISRGQWEALACSLYSSLPPTSAKRRFSADGQLVLKAKEYNCSVEFYWSPYLVELNNKHESGRRVLVLDQIVSSAKYWIGCDVMIFNSGFWWNHPVGVRKWDIYEYKGQLIENLSIHVAFNRAMKTWANWMENNVDPSKTKVMYRSMSAEHYGNQWCYQTTQPMTLNERYKSRFPKAIVKAGESVVKKMTKLQVINFDIAKLSQTRRDAHPSIYRTSEWKKGLATNSRPNADCSHWCLPGVPDTWNRLLYAFLLFDSLGKDSNSATPQGKE